MFKGFFLYLCLFNNKYKYIHESTLLRKLLKWNKKITKYIFRIWYLAFWNDDAQLQIIFIFSVNTIHFDCS